MDEFTRQAIAEADRIAAACRQSEIDDDDALCQRLGYSPSEKAQRSRLSRDGRALWDRRREEKLQAQASAEAARRAAAAQATMTPEQQKLWDDWARGIARGIATEVAENYRLKFTTEDGEELRGADAVIELINDYDETVIAKLCREINGICDKIREKNQKQDARVDELARTIAEMGAEIEVMRAKLEKRTTRSKAIPFLELKGGYGDEPATRN